MVKMGGKKVLKVSEAMRGFKELMKNTFVAYCKSKTFYSEVSSAES